MNPLEIYAQAQVAAVPSFAFIETFSRVVIEAQRHGIPFIGTMRGNVPYLLAGPGIALEQEADLWAQEIERVSADTEYFEERRAAALKNAEAFPFSKQYARVQRFRQLMIERFRTTVRSAGSGRSRRWLLQQNSVICKPRDAPAGHPQSSCVLATFECGDECDPIPLAKEAPVPDRPGACQSRVQSSATTITTSIRCVLKNL
jgi:hypothetical protein